MTQKLAAFPRDIALQKLFYPLSRVDRENVRNVHVPLPVLPDVFLVAGRNGFVARCLSCNVCQRCHDDAFRGEGELHGGVYVLPLRCDCPGMQCEICKRTVARRGFSDGRWHNRHAQSMICLMCEEAKTFHPCKLCKELRSKESFNESMWHHRVLQAPTCNVCLDKSAEPETYACQQCGEPRTKENFNESMWHNRVKQKATCNTCLKKRKYPPCTMCSKPMPTGKQRTRFNKSGKTSWTCADCLTLQESRAVQAKNREEESWQCEKCQRVLPRNHYSNSRWIHRTHRRVACIECESTHACSKCGLKIHKDSCTKSQWEKRNRSLFCKECHP